MQVMAPAISGLFEGFDPGMQSVIDNLGPAIPVFGLALALGAILTALCIRASRPLGMMKEPNRERDLHAVSTPMLGGLALYLAFTGVALIFVPASMERNVVLIISGAATLLFALDDRWRLPAWSKFAGQMLIALVAIVGFGSTFQITFFSVPLLGIIHTGWLALPVSLFWLLGMQNTINLIDGVDGLAGGVVAIVAAILVIAAASIGQHEVVALAAALAGACCGFLLFNFHPARIFMGDSGAHFLGLALGLLSIIGVSKVPVAFAIAIPVLALAVPIADTAWSIVRRRIAGVSFAQADARHLHHRLLAFGLNQKETCIVFYGATGVLGAVALTLLGHRRILGIMIVAMVVGIGLLLRTHIRATRRHITPSLRALLTRRASR
jgi:UDP-GlcNAc:undecaprenyl-phosphate/decaprenyl-phosphate GlcNAc-1-phosphate transferase